MKKTMTSVIFLMTGVVAVSLGAACSNQTSQPTGGNVANTNSAATVKVEPAMPPSDKGDHVATGGDLAFMTDAAAGNMAEVELGKLAETHGLSKEVKAFGARMVADHSKAGEELKGLAAQKKVTAPPEMTPKQKETMTKLSKLNGAEFDRAYVMDMVEDHEKDVTAFEATAKTATDQDVKNFAAKTLPVLKEHLQMIREMSGKMGAKPK